MDKKFDFELKKVWQWLLYMYIVLPVLLFLSAFITKNMTIGVSLARLYHSYCMYIVNPVPHMPSFTGIAGAIIALIAVFKTLYKRDMKDFSISALLIVLNTAYYLTGINYLLIKYLTFA